MPRRESDMGTGITRLWWWVFNCYVVDDGGQGAPLVIDPGLPKLASMAGELVSVTEHDGVVPVVATHGHVDHVGGVANLGNRHAIDLYLPERDERYLAGERPRNPSVRAMVRFLPVLRDAPFDPRAIVDMTRGGRQAGFGGIGKYRMSVPASGFLSDGDMIPGAPDWRVIRSPGHTDDSISFYNRQTKTMFSGDTVVTCKGRAWFNPEYVDGEALGESEDRLRGVRVDQLFPGHGKPIAGRDVLAYARPHHP